MLTCRSDFVFKKVMSEYPAILRNVTKCLFEVSSDFTFLDTEQKLKCAKEKKRISGLLVLSNDKIVDYEVNVRPNINTFNRNHGYICKVFGDSFKKGRKGSFKKAILVNFNYEWYDKFDVSKYVMRNEVNIVLMENVVIYNINMDKLKRAYYNENKELIDKYKYLIMLDLNEQELEDFCKGDEIVNMYREVIKDINGNVLFQPIYTEEEKRELELDDQYNNGIDEGFAKGVEFGIEHGIDQGIIQGIEQGIEQEKFNTAINMLKKTDDLKFISSVTGLSIKKIKQFQNSIL